MDELTPEPSIEELLAVTRLARINRLVASGLTPDQALAEFLRQETPEEYAARNRAAMDELEARILSPEYMERFASIQAEADPAKRARLEAELKRENFKVLDMDAVRRTISSRNRQFKAEGILPPDAPI